MKRVKILKEKQGVRKWQLVSTDASLATEDSADVSSELVCTC